MWLEKSGGVFVAETRVPKNKQEFWKFEKEECQAKILADMGHEIFLVPETGGGKHFDAIIDGLPFELKTVDGGESAVSHRFRDSLDQCTNAYLRIKSEISPKRVKEILKGVLKTKAGNGIVYCYLDCLDSMIMWNMSDLK